MQENNKEPEIEAILYINTPRNAVEITNCLVESGYRVQVGPFDTFTMGIRITIYK